MRPEARPASCGFVPATAPIVTGTNEKPRPAPATIDGNSTSPRRCRRPAPREPHEPGGDEQHPAHEHRLEAEPRDELRRHARRDDDRQRERQVGQARLHRVVAEHALHVERHEEEHREQRHADQQADDVRRAQRPQPEDPERHERRLRPRLDRRRTRRAARPRAASRHDASAPSPSRRSRRRRARRRGSTGPRSPSRRPRCRTSGARRRASRRGAIGASAAAATPIGTLTNSTHSQLSASVSTPPSRTPAAPPEPATAPQTPSALLRSAPSANVVVTSDSAAGDSSAAPRPCTARAMMS